MITAYKRAYTEVIEIIKYFPNEEYAKIPLEKINYYKENMDKDYNFKINPNIELEKQNISREANAILVTLFNDYFATDRQKEILNNLLKQNQQILEELKQEKYNMENDCVITSFSSSALLAAKSCDENIRVGYILSAAYGDYYDMKNIDFFSVNAAFLSKRTIDAIHNSGKQVYAWTVNNKDSIKNLTNKGVDGVITDNPVLARETIYSRDTSETIVNMIRYVFNQ